ncbi:MAG: transposase [Actinomycetales bacterium]|nr:transposase [Actinomycetales bacterium]
MNSRKQSCEQGPTGPVDPAPRPARRTFTAEYKAAVVAEYEAAPHGEKSAILRREGLFHSHVREWTGARDAARSQGTPGPSATTRQSRAERDVERLRAENARLTAKLTQTQAALTIMGKAHELLSSLVESSDSQQTSNR